MAFHRSTCPFCSCGCGLLLQEEHGRLVASYPAARPPAQSSLCIRGWNCTSSWSHRDRLTTPMVRGEAGLVRATWREAVEEIAGRLANASAPALFAVGPSVANEDAFAVRRLAERVGGRLSVTDLTGAPAARRALGQVLGRNFGLADPDAIANADLVWVFGADDGDCPQVASRVVEARRNGATIVRFDVHASAGDGSRVVTLLPGRFGDVALLLQRAALEADLVPAEVRTAAGFDDLSRYWREAIASGDAPWVGSEEALALARDLRAAKRPVAIVGGRWLSSREAESHTVALVQALALLGASDRLVFAVGEANSWGLLDIVGEDGARPAELACREEGLDTLFVVGDDILRRSPRPASLAEALSSLRAVVVIDRFVTDCTPFAHVVLPACGFAETDGSVTSVFGDVQRWQRVVAPPGDCEPERVWMSRIDERLGAIAGSEAGMSVPTATDDLPAARVNGPTRLAFSAPVTEPPGSTVETSEAFGLSLVVGSLPANWSTGIVAQRDEILRREIVESILAASPATLKDAGVKPGWPVKLVVPGGEATVTVRADKRLPGGVVVLVPLAGSPSAALRGCYPGAGGRSVGLQPVPARIERAPGQG